MSKLKLKDYFWVVLFFLIVGNFLYPIFKRAMADHLLKTRAIQIKAVVIDEKIHVPNGHIHPDWSYAYSFVVDGKAYTENSHDPNLRVGDSVEIEYVKGWPSLNRPLHIRD